MSEGIKAEDLPLDVRIEGDKLTIEIGIGTLAYAVNYYTSYWDFVVDDKMKAAESILSILCREDEFDGSTIVHHMLDTAAHQAIEHGYEGFKYSRGTADE